MTTYHLESEITFIKKVIEDSRRVTLDNGKYYILLGVIIPEFVLYYRWKNELTLVANE